MAVSRLVEIRGSRSLADIAALVRAEGDLACESQAIYQMERGSCPLGPRFIKYAKALGISPEELATIFEDHRKAAPSSGE